MDQFEYVVGLLSIITGLALADMGVSLHRLLKRRSLVKWDWLVLATAAYISFIVIRYWYQVWSVHTAPGVTNLFFFTGIIFENLLLFLMAASALPDEEDYSSGAVDLRSFGEKNSVYIWRIFLLFAVAWAAHGIYFMRLGNQLDTLAWLIFAAPVALGAGLAFTRRRSVQIVLFAGLVAHEMWWISTSNF